MRLAFTPVLFALLLGTAVLTPAWARKPAVEDFVGVDVDQPEVVPSGMETLVNFDHEVSNFKPVPTKVVVRPQAQAGHPAPATSTSHSSTFWFGVAFVLCLPMITWGAMARHLRKREAGLSASATPSNVIPLSAHKSEKKGEADYKKAS